MFLTKLAKVPRSEILDLLPQIRVVNAFKIGAKKDGKNRNKNEENWESEEKDDRFACFIQQKDESPEKKKEDEKEKETRRKRKDSVDAPEEVFLLSRKKDVPEEKPKDRKTVSTHMRPHIEVKALSAYELSFGNKSNKK